MKNYIIYKGGFIAKSSEAYVLWEAGKWKELDARLKQTKDAAIKRGELRATKESQ